MSGAGLTMTSGLSCPPLLSGYKRELYTDRDRASLQLCTHGVGWGSDRDTAGLITVLCFLVLSCE